MIRSAIFSLLAAAVCLASTPPSEVFTINVPPPGSAKDVQVRYFISGEFGAYGSSSVAETEGNKIVISTSYEGKRATKLAAVAYAPGCEFVTISVDELASGNRDGSFQCTPLRTVQFHGRISGFNS